MKKKTIDPGKPELAPPERIPWEVVKSPHSPRASEWSEQCAVIDWRNRCLGARPYLFMLFHTPNGEKREQVEYTRRDGSKGTWSPSGMRAKLAGASPGVPDLILPIRRGGFNGLAVEMKINGGSLSDDQKAWLRALALENWKVAVCYGAQAAIELIDQYDALDD